MKPQTLLLAVLLALAPVALAAQDSLVHATIDSGTLVRFHPKSGSPIRGRLLQPLSPASTVVLYCHYPALPCTNLSDSASFGRLPVTSLTRVELQTGTKWATGAVIGGAFGAVLGGLFAAAANSMCDTSDCVPPAAVDVLVTGAFFGLLGGFIGSTSTKWAPAP